MLWKRSLVLTALLCTTFCYSQTQLKAGDIAIIGLDCESEDFMFVTFVPLVEGTEIYFTDEEANGSYQIGLGEGTVLYSVPAGGLSRGSVISFKTNAADFEVTSDGNIALSNSGDGLIAYQGGLVGEVSVFLDALGSDLSSIGNFPGGFNGRILGSVNGQYQGNRIGSNQASYLVRINDLNEWQLSDSSVSPLDISSFSFDTVPILFTSRTELSNLGYDFDTATEVFELVIDGAHLSAAVEISAPSNFEISTNHGGPYSDTISLTPNAGAISSYSIFVRLKEGLIFSAYTGKLRITSIGANSLEVDLKANSRMGFEQYCSDLFISEYVEGSSNNKYVEIFNPTVVEISLTDNYTLEIYSNGSAIPSRVVNLVGAIDANGVFIVEHPSEVVGVVSDQQSGNLSFNGNDALVLKKEDDVIDVVGQVGIDPGSEWVGGACLSGTQDGGLIRNSDIKNGTKSTSSLFNIDNEWKCTSLNDVSNLGFHIVDNPSKLTKWDGLSWDNGIPDENDVVLLRGDYNTQLHGEINACIMYLSKNVDVNVKALNPIVLDGDILIKGSLTVDTFGSFVQTNDRTEFKLVESGSAQLTKSTSTLNNWYEYTYWSSPVTSIPIETVLNATPSNRRFYFEAANFIDVLEEVGNTGVYNPGTDGIDDDGNSWQIATGIMAPGVGYAATASSSGFIAGSQNVHFSGEFNNGVIITPVVANSGGAYSDWNFFGNPYSGGLDALKFLSENSELISGALYLWSHNTPPSNTNSGNEGQNFSNSDYAIITGSGVNVAGGDGIIPESFIPSAQGFFVEAVKSGDLVFNNSMRAYSSNSNSQFFKSPKKIKLNEPAILWLDLTTETGVFSQIAIGFFDEATNDYDGSFFDVQRMGNFGSPAQLYSQIKNEENYYVIQGRSNSNASKYESIQLGVNSFIQEETVFKIDIARTSKGFKKGRPIYLFDKSNGIYHDLNRSPFEFSTSKANIKDRFELRFFKGNHHDKIVNSNVFIRENAIGEVQFVSELNESIEQVLLYDLLGRKLYDFRNVRPEEWFNISKVPKGIYLSKIQLKSNHVLFKKVLKRN